MLTSCAPALDSDSGIAAARRRRDGGARWQARWLQQDPQVPAGGGSGAGRGPGASVSGARRTGRAPAHAVACPAGADLACGSARCSWLQHRRALLASPRDKSTTTQWPLRADFSPSRNRNQLLRLQGGTQARRAGAEAAETFRVTRAYRRDPSPQGRGTRCRPHAPQSWTALLWRSRQDSYLHFCSLATKLRLFPAFCEPSSSDV